ncbi:hypothetical protein D3C84_273230 [compost metagenome]
MAVDGLVPAFRTAPRQRLGEEGGLLQRLQALTPEALADQRITGLQPVDIVAVAARRRQRLAEVAAQHLADQQRQAPAIQQQVVIGPYEVVAALVQAHQQQALQRRTAEVEGPLALLAGQGLEVLCRGFTIAPVQQIHRQLHFAVDDLHGIGETLPDKAAAQAVMARADLVPGRDEARCVEAVDTDRQLVHVEVAAGRVQGMEQHALLHGRQRHYVLDVLQRHRQRGQGSGVQVAEIQSRHRTSHGIRVKGARLGSERPHALVQEKILGR